LSCFKIVNFERHKFFLIFEGSVSPIFPHIPVIAKVKFFSIDFFIEFFNYFRVEHQKSKLKLSFILNDKMNLRFGFWNIVHRNMHLTHLEWKPSQLEKSSWLYGQLRFDDF